MLAFALPHSATLAAPPECRYEAPTRTLTVSLEGADRFRYVFNKGGAISGIFDLAIAPEQNLIGASFQGESTDRVIQWTYWNSRYKVPRNPAGDKDRRANATMEGSFADAATCDVISGDGRNQAEEYIEKQAADLGDAADRCADQSEATEDHPPLVIVRLVAKQHCATSKQAEHREVDQLAIVKS